MSRCPFFQSATFFIQGQSPPAGPARPGTSVTFCYCEHPDSPHGVTTVGRARAPALACGGQPQACEIASRPAPDS